MPSMHSTLKSLVDKHWGSQSVPIVSPLTTFQMTNYEIQNIDGCVRIVVRSDRLDADCLTLNLTPEGLIVDAIQNDDVISTSSRMWEEIEEELLVW